jgi:hypothetical protein
MQTHFPVSAYQARVILGASQSGDVRRINAELERVGQLKATDAAEEERLELLSGIADELRSSEQPFGDELYGSLLEHLANLGGRRRGPTPVLGRGRAVAATALQ